MRYETLKQYLEKSNQFEKLKHSFVNAWGESFAFISNYAVYIQTWGEGKNKRTVQICIPKEYINDAEKTFAYLTAQKFAMKAMNLNKH